MYRVIDDYILCCEKQNQWKVPGGAGDGIDACSWGLAAGGIAGKVLFQYVAGLSSDRNRVGAVQAICLLVVTIGTLLYTLYKDRIHTYHVKSALWCCVIGAVLGIMSSFLGIGGGPINLVVFVFLLFNEYKNCGGKFPLYHILFPACKFDTDTGDSESSGLWNYSIAGDGGRRNLWWDLRPC